MIKQKKWKKALQISALALVGVTLVSGYALKPAVANAESSYTKRYLSDYNSKYEASMAGLELNQDIVREGMVLLKNKDNALPIKTGVGTNAAKVSVFGYRAAKPDGGAAGGNDSSAGVVTVDTDIFLTLEHAGYDVNPTLYEAYTGAIASTGAASDYALKEAGFDLNAYTGSYAKYGDAAIVVLSAGANTKDSMLTTTYGHKLDFDAAQKELVEHAKANFEKVIVLINTASQMEMAWLENDDQIDAILHINLPGDGGFTIIGEILSGKVNPSGHTTDTWANDFNKIPSMYNFCMTNYITEDGNPIATGASTKATYEEYEEGIYIGYRYYETVADMMTSGGEEWYQENVVYPYGYGLSYTNFTYEIVGSSLYVPTAENVDKKMSVQVKVTNVGDVAGKAVVQMYNEAPFTGAIEKSSVALCNFVKTSLLDAGESEIVTLTTTARDLASYDYLNHKGYVLEQGTYNLSIRTDSHTEIDQVSFELASDLKIETSLNGTVVENQFDDLSTHMEGENVDQLSRSDMAVDAGDWDIAEHVSTPVAGEGTSLDYKTAEEYYEAFEPKRDSYDQYYEDIETPTFADEETRPEKAEVVLEELVGKSFDDPLWDELLSQLTYEEVRATLQWAGFQTYAIDYIEKPYCVQTDGPKGWTGSGTDGVDFAKFCVEPLMGATWNTELLYQVGVIIGEQGLWGSTDAGEDTYSYTNWYAPGLNIHRTPFDGRYNEYYTEDPYMMGILAANVSLGAETKGCYVCIKHMTAYEDSASLNWSICIKGMLSDEMVATWSEKAATSCTAVWEDEQTLREIYLRPFQIAVEQGKAGSIMTSMGRLGTTHCVQSYALNTAVTREEWGFKGVLITDIVGTPAFDNVSYVLSGGSLILMAYYLDDYYMLPATEDLASDSVKKAMYRAIKETLYELVNSNAMQVPHGAKINVATTELADATKGTEYTSAIEASVSTLYAYHDVAYEVTAGKLPAGLTLDAATGEISGTPTKAGVYEFTVTASAKDYESAVVNYTIEVADNEDRVGDIIGDVEDVNNAVNGIDGKLDTTNSAIEDLKATIEALQGQITALENAGTSGCTSVVGGSVACVGALLVAVFVLRKKED